MYHCYHTLIGIAQEIRPRKQSIKPGNPYSRENQLLSVKDRNGPFRQKNWYWMTWSVSRPVIRYRQMRGCLEGSVEVNESLLTGESDNLPKNVGDELFSGSFVTSGEANCQIIHVGKDNYAAQITSEAKEFKRHNSELKNSLNAFWRWSVSIIVPLEHWLILQAVLYCWTYI